MDTVKARKAKAAKAEAGALTCKEAAASYRVKRPKDSGSVQKRAANAGRVKGQKAQKHKYTFDAEGIAAYIKDQCKTRKSTLAYFLRIGLTYNEKGEPLVVPR